METNYVAVLVAALSSMVIGFLWYGPIFGKKWIAMMKFTPEQMTEAKAKGMTKSYVWTFIGALVTAFVLAKAITLATSAELVDKSGAALGVCVALWGWLGFVGPITLGSVLWDNKPWSLWVLNNAHSIVSLGIAGAILAAWM